jgi:hypothetical protein
MRWEAKAAQRRWEWHRWFAWHPVRIPQNRYESGHWVWWEPMERKYKSSWGGGEWHYRELGTKEEAA